MTRPPLLVLAVGNPSRGDDALGPALLEQLRQAGVDATGAVELLTDFQLQIEHALDVADRQAVLFVDAALPGAAAAGAAVRMERLYADPRVPPASHALRAQAVLHVTTKLTGRAPPAWQLAIEGERFELGEGLSDAAGRRLDRAVVLATGWLREHGAAAVPGGPPCMS